ncbi:hypothetical protein D3K13_09930 [Escherichia coli]|nr:hypothetical protein [Escherichia coli]
MTKRLTWEQKSIVSHDTGHALVKAVPGSGKTTTLVKRVERLVKTGTDPRSILILMYNKSAQVSFTEKLKTALMSSVIPEIRTFHSLALKIVGYGERQQIIKKKDLITPSDYRYEQLVKQAYRYGFDHEANYIDPNEIENFELFIARCRAAAVTPVDAANDPTFSNIKRKFIHAYGRYCELLEENSLRTFDDCLIEAVALLRNDSSLGAHFKHIIVDEYQDVNLIQHDMTRLLSKSDTSVMAVGDVNHWHSTSMCLDSFINVNGCFLLWRAKGETLMSAIDSQLPSSSGQDRPTDEVDRILSPGKLIILGLQHVLVMYAGAVAVPLMIGDRLGLSKEAIAMLISSDLFCCGIVTLLQCIGIGRFMGIRLPVIMSVTFAAVTPMIAIGMNPDIGLLGIFGATIAAGFITTLLAPLIGRLMPLFPPLVTGVVITSIGLSIIQVGIDWAAGGKGNPQYGNPVYLGISFAVLIFILLITRYAKGFMSNVAVLLGIVFGFLLSWMMNEVNLSGLHDASWFAIVTPMSFGMPIFDPVSILTMTAVLIIVFIESMGMFLALGEIVGRKLSSHDIIRGLRVDGVGTMIGGTFNSFPHTSFSQNVGLVSVTRVHSRWVCISSGIILILFGMVPKMAVLVASIPQFVLGGAGLVMFGMVLATGIRILSRCNYTTNRYNLYIVAISLGVGMTPTLSHDFFSKLPAVLQPLLHSGIMLATLSAVVLNVFFNGYQHHADLVKESVSDKDLKVRTVRMWLLMRKLKKNEHGE